MVNVSRIALMLALAHGILGGACLGQTVLDHPLPPEEERNLVRLLSDTPTASLGEMLCGQGGLYRKRVVLAILASRTTDAQTLPVLRNALARLNHPGFHEASLRGDVRVAIVKVAAKGDRQSLINGLCELLRPDDEKETISAAALALQHLGGDDAADALRRMDHGQPMIRLSRYHIELDPLPIGEAVGRIFTEARRRMESSDKDLLVPEGSYLCSRGKAVLPLLRLELADVQKRPPGEQKLQAYEGMLKEAVSAIERQPTTTPAERF